MADGPRAVPSAVLVGLMSGTSMDGVSAAVVRFTESERGIDAQLLAFVEHPYSPAQRTRLTAALTGATPSEYTRLDFELGEWLAQAAIAVMAEAGVARADVAAIASHGHTVWHEPPHATWQFGQAAVIAERTGLDVIADFRVRDVAAGGQGAPLVPIADALLFAAPDHHRALQNLGGIGNITIVPAVGSTAVSSTAVSSTAAVSQPVRSTAGVSQPVSPTAAVASTAGVRAFDTGPGVAIIDGVVRRLRADQSFDRDGTMAAAGEPIRSVVDATLAHPYFSAAPPKSTGRELFSASLIDAFMRDCRGAKRDCSDNDIVATATSLTARSIALAFERFIPEPVAELVISGGGARNPTLVRYLQQALIALPNRPELNRSPVAFDALYFDARAKEAVAFAFLGWLHLLGRPGNVPTATGARGPRVLGVLTPGSRNG